MINLLVNEIFGPTIQGEGPSTGKNAVFLRLAGCNLTCSWCDSWYAWDWKRVNSKEEMHSMTVGEVVEELLNHGLLEAPLLVITGGEPLLQQDMLKELFEKIYFKELQIPGYDRPTKQWQWAGRIEIETAGTLPPLSTHGHGDGIYYNVSPKLFGSGNAPYKRYKPAFLRQLLETDQATFKFVISSLEELDEVGGIVGELEIPNELVYIQPEGIDHEVLTQHLQDWGPAIIERGWNISTRLQIYIWGNKRGV